MPRPPAQRHTNKQIVELGPDLKESLENGSLQKLLIIHETGQAVKGFLSTNAGAILATGGIVATLLSFKTTRDYALSFITFMQQQLNDLIFSWFHEGVTKSAQGFIDELNRRVKELAEALRKALLEEEKNTPLTEDETQCPPGQHPEFVTTPAGLIVQCVDDFPGQ